MVHDFFKRKGDFLHGIVSTKPITYTIVILYQSGYRKERRGIDHPWKYINEVKKNPNVKAAWIKE